MGKTNRQRRGGEKNERSGRLNGSKEWKREEREGVEMMGAKEVKREIFKSEFNNVKDRCL